MTVQSAPSSEAGGIAEGLVGGFTGRRVVRVINAVALGVGLALAGSIILVIAIFCLAILYAVVRMAFGG